MNKKTLIISSLTILNSTIAYAQEGPFSSIFGEKGLVGGIMDGLRFIIYELMSQPFMPFVAVFLMVYAMIYYLARKTFFKEAAGRNPAIVFALAVALISLYPKFGLVDLVAGYGAAFVAVVLLFALIFAGWTSWSTGRATAAEASAAKSEAIAGARKAGGEAERAGFEQEEGRRRARIERAKGGEEEERAMAETRERGRLRGRAPAEGIVTQTINILTRLQSNPTDQNEQQRFRNSIDLLRRNIARTFPQQVMEINARYGELVQAYKTNNQKAIKDSLQNKLPALLVLILKKLRKTP